MKTEYINKKCSRCCKLERHRIRNGSPYYICKACSKVDRKKYYEDHREEHLNKRRVEFRGVAEKYGTLCSMAQKRGIVVGITVEEFSKIIYQLCYYCGGALPRTGHGMDRIDSGYGYIFGNVRPCCTNCNLAKRSLSEEEFREWALRLYEWASKGK